MREFYRVRVKGEGVDSPVRAADESFANRDVPGRGARPRPEGRLMLTDSELQGLARTVAGLPPDQERAVADAVAEIRAERARLDEERLADLRSMTDEAVVELMFVRHHDNWPNPDALTLLREAGFVRGAVLERAYREGYERGAFDAHTGTGPRLALPDEDDPDYVAARGYDLASLTKGA